jgi:hypothetical protein
MEAKMVLAVARFRHGGSGIPGLSKIEMRDCHGKPIKTVIL